MANAWLLTERQKTIDLFLRSCANLYGHITPRQFLLIYNRYNSDKLLKADLLRFSRKLNHQAKNYRIFSDAIINMREPIEVLADITMLQEGKKYYIPDREELLRWADDNYMPITPQSEKLRTDLLNKFHVSILSVGLLTRELFHSILIEEEPQAQMDIFARYHVFEKSDLRTVSEFFTHTFMDYINNTRRWANCGFTPIEMR